MQTDRSVFQVARKLVRQIGSQGTIGGCRSRAFAVLVNWESARGQVDIAHVAPAQQTVTATCQNRRRSLPEAAAQDSKTHPQSM